MKEGIDIYNKKVRRSHLNGLIPFAATIFDILNICNLMVAIKINDNNLNNSESNISYQIGKFQRTSTALNFFITKLVSAGFLKSGHILICDNASIHLTEENKSLAEILWEDEKILLIYLPPYSPKCVLCGVGDTCTTSFVYLLGDIKEPFFFFDETVGGFLFSSAKELPTVL